MISLKMSVYISIVSILVQSLFSDTIWADIILDSTFDDKFNEFDYSWYYYDDNYRVGFTDRPQAAPQSVASVVDVPFTSRSRMFKGDTSDTHKVKIYKFRTDSIGVNHIATFPFTFGDVFTTPEGWDANPYAGIGTNLARSGKWVDLTGVEKIRFKIRARKDSLSVTFKVQTFEIDSISSGNATELHDEDNSPEGYYSVRNIPVSKVFEEKEIQISGGLMGCGELTPPEWAVTALPYNIRRVTKLSWEISMEDNPDIKSDTVDIDDVVLVSSYIKNWNPYLWTKTVLRKLPDHDLFNSFDKDRFDDIATSGTFWYAFDDVQYGGSSIILYGATRNSSNSLYDLTLLNGTGYNGVSKGAKLTCRIGDAVKKTADSEDRGFVGIGCNLYDSSNAIYWNAEAEKVNNLYFQYNTTGAISFVTLEVRDNLDAGDKLNPDRKDSRGNGIVHFRRFPPTNGTWVTVNIPFDSLKIHQNWVTTTVARLNTSKLAKIEWKVQGAEGVTGTLAIDNVFFPCRVIDYGIDKELKKYLCYDEMDDSVGVTHQTMNKKTSEHIIVLSSGSSLKIINANHRTDWNIELMDCSGKRIATCSGSSDNITLPVNKLSSGMYFVRVVSKQRELSSPRKMVPVLITK
ncbi:MAG TPA: T9SS type A sorting domain-containing protein [Chitinispirillaceae bacterium]|nr:T9SS type A sorting domain-containing protein [Chitinispirillaceae bacterium]